MEIKIIDAIQSIKKDSQVSISGENINNIEWHDGNPTNITNEQILAKQIELQAEEDNRIAQELANKQSALNKLKALGLNDAEIKAIIGN